MLINLDYFFTIVEEALRRAAGEIRSGMTKKCSQIETVITLERSKVEQFEISQMSLNDRNCLAEKNETHWILKSKR